MTLPLLLDEHTARMGACRRCGLDGILPIVSEARNPRVILVGQAPGKVEVESRKPFAGRAGRTLFRWLERAGLDEVRARERIYISAITRCFPGPSPSGRGDRVPSPKEQAMCSEWLESELKIIRPALLIPVGRLAIDRFLGPLPLDEVIGRGHVIEVEGRRTTLVPLPHPSGASSWIHAPGHGALLDRALELLRGEFKRLRVSSSGPARRSA